MGVKNLKIFFWVEKLKKFEQLLFMSNRQLYTHYNTELAFFASKRGPPNAVDLTLIFHLKNPTNQD